MRVCAYEHLGMTTVEHAPAEVHRHTHGPGCGHDAVVHRDHVDYLHDGHLHREHVTDGGVHYDECDKCRCAHCADSCAQCDCSECDCPTCNHATCACSGCNDTCANCTCSDCNCSTCEHAA
jgi:hypothetical protein